MFYLCREKNKTLFWANKALFYHLRKRNANRNIKKQLVAAISGYVGNMRFVCVFEAVYVCVCAGQSKTGSIVKAFETLLRYCGNMTDGAVEHTSVVNLDHVISSHMPTMNLIKDV